MQNKGYNGRLIGFLFVFLFFFVVASRSRSDVSPVVAKEHQNRPLKIMVISDLNDSYGSVAYSNDVTAVIREIKHIKPDIILCGGDMVAGQKASLTEERLNEMWQSFDRHVLKPVDSMGIPFGFTLGNHDASPGYIKDRVAAKAFWINKRTATNLTFVDDTHFPFYFSYIKNNVFFLSWDASSASIPLAVMEWMKGQLKSEIATKSRIRILLGHLPLYAIVAAKNKEGEVISRADSTLDFFRNNGIDLYISGHQHAYFPGHKRGVQLFNAGCLGGGPRSLMGHNEGPKKAYSIIEVPRQSKGYFRFNAFLPESNSPIPITRLPDSIQGFNGTIRRIDIR